MDEQHPPSTNPALRLSLFTRLDKTNWGHGGGCGRPQTDLPEIISNASEDTRGAHLLGFLNASRSCLPRAPFDTILPDAATAELLLLRLLPFASAKFLYVGLALLVSAAAATDHVVLRA